MPVGEPSAAERRYRRLYGNAPEGTIRTSPDGPLLAANPAMLRPLGVATAAEAIARYTDLATPL